LNGFLNQDYTKTIEPMKSNGEDLYYNNQTQNKSATLQEFDLFKIAVRNLSEQEILANFPQLANND
jgi:hypothetical protein